MKKVTFNKNSFKRNLFQNDLKLFNKQVKLGGFTQSRAYKLSSEAKEVIKGFLPREQAIDFTFAIKRAKPSVDKEYEELISCFGSSLDFQFDKNVREVINASRIAEHVEGAEVNKKCLEELRYEFKTSVKVYLNKRIFDTVASSFGFVASKGKPMIYDVLYSIFCGKIVLEESEAKELALFFKNRFNNGDLRICTDFEAYVFKCCVNNLWSCEGKHLVLVRDLIDDMLKDYKKK